MLLLGVGSMRSRSVYLFTSLLRSLTGVAVMKRILVLLALVLMCSGYAYAYEMEIDDDGNISWIMGDVDDIRYRVSDDGKISYIFPPSDLDQYRRYPPRWKRYYPPRGR